MNDSHKEAGAEVDRRLDWVESHSLENLRSHLEATQAIKGETVTTLAVVMAASAACTAYVVQAFDKGPLSDTGWGAAAMILWLYVVGSLMVTRCLRVADAPSPTNHAKNIYHPAFSLASVREIELRNIDERIEQALQRNRATSNWINRLRFSALITPIWCFIGIAVHHFWLRHFS